MQTLVARKPKNVLKFQRSFTQFLKSKKYLYNNVALTTFLWFCFYSKDFVWILKFCCLYPESTWRVILDLIYLFYKTFSSKDGSVLFQHARRLSSRDYHSPPLAWRLLATPGRPLPTTLWEHHRHPACWLQRPPHRCPCLLLTLPTLQATLTHSHIR